MKKLLCIFFLLALLICTVASCDQAVCQHRDADDNALCDKCGAAYGDGIDVADDRTPSEKAVQELYSQAQQLGYTGSLDDFLALCKGADGQDGVSISNVEIDENGNLLVYYSNAPTKAVNLGNVIGAQGEKGDKGDTGATGANGGTPKIRINEETNEWEVSVDNGITWISTEVKATGANGNDGETPHVGDNGNWWIGTRDTGVQARGEKGEDGQDGVMPHIGSDGNWWIGTANTGIKAQGEKGDKGDTGAQGEKGDKGDTGATGANGITPKIRINEETNEWEVSVDDGVTWISTEVKATGANGNDGETPYVGDNGNWWIGTKDTGVQARGEKGEDGQDGVMPHIGSDGNWWIGTANTGIKAQGEKGDKGDTGEKGEDGKDGTVVEIGANGNWFLDGVDTGVSVNSTSLAGVTEKVKNSTVTILTELSNGFATGSGFVYDDQGHICTNAHVVEGATFVQVVLPNGTVREANVVGYDVNADVAVLHVDPAGLVPADLGDSAQLATGDSIFAVGSPTGLSYYTTVTYGRVSAAQRSIWAQDAETGVVLKWHMIQIDVAVNPGNSGGPVADAYGRVVGIVTLKDYSVNNVPLEHMSYALPINGVKIIVDDIIENGKLTQENPLVTGHAGINASMLILESGIWYGYDSAMGGFMGSLDAVPGYLYASHLSLGVVDPGDHSELQTGDIILKVDGLSPVYTMWFYELLALHEPGDEITLTVWRDGAELEITIALIDVPFL